MAAAQEVWLNRERPFPSGQQGIERLGKSFRQGNNGTDYKAAELKKTNIENWHRALWLNRSAETFAKHFCKEEWQAAIAHRGEKPWTELFEDSAKGAKASGKAGMDVFSQMLGEFVQKGRPKEQLLEKAKNQIQYLLKQGVYHGYGYDQERTLATDPVRIPSECWNGKVSWSSNVLCFQSLKFREVRIRFQRANLDPPPTQADDPIPVRLGRPSFKEPILQAFNALYADGQIDTGAPIKSHWPQLRKYLLDSQARLPKPANEISDETFRRYLSLEIKSLKKTTKQ